MRYRAFLRTHLKDVIPANVILPSGFHVVGHVALVHLNSDAMKYASVLGEVTLDYDHRLRTVAVQTGPTKGIERRPAYRVVAGCSDTVTEHIENKVRFKLDPIRMTFSGGNKGERIGISKLVKAGECVVDMFSCVGQFALHVARRNDVKVIAIEINSEAYRFLVENIKMNGLEDRVSAILGDCRIVHPNHIANRVIMGYLHDTEEFLPAAIDTLITEGGTIHMHKAVAGSFIEDTITSITKICDERRYKARIEIRKIKHYSPGVNHVVFDINTRPI
jgi:tRNA wybutosine-synthesizing protein 2